MQAEGCGTGAGAGDVLGSCMPGLHDGGTGAVVRALRHHHRQ